MAKKACEGKEVKKGDKTYRCAKCGVKTDKPKHLCKPEKND